MKKDEETFTSDVLVEGNEKNRATDRTGYSYETSLNYLNVDWMGKLSDNIRLSQLSIPGTHGSTALHGKTGFDEDIARNQRMSITTQLNSGIRYLDMRARRTGTTFAMHHGPVYQKKMFGDVLQEMTTFLRQNPNEMILMRLKEEHTPESGSLSFEEIFKKYRDNNTSYFWNPNSFSGTDKTNPKLGNVRGKIVVVQNFSASQTYGIEYSSLSKQDLDEIESNADAVYNKWTKVKEKLFEAHGSDKSTIYLNHLSGNVKNVWEGIVGFVKPWFIASGNQSRSTDGLRRGVFDNYHPGNPNYKYPDYPSDIAGQRMYEGTNNLTMHWIQRGSVQHTGIIAADFPGKGLIDPVIRLNERHNTEDIRYITPQGSTGLRVGFGGDVYLRNHYVVHRNGEYIGEVVNGNPYYSYWDKTDVGHDLRFANLILFTGDKIDVFVKNESNLTLLKSQLLDVYEQEGEEIRVADGTYMIKSALNSTSMIALNKSDRNAVLWHYEYQLNFDFDFKYDENKKAYRIINRWDPTRALGWDGVSINVFGMGLDASKDEQYWIIKRAGQGYVNIFNKKNGTVLDVTGGGTANGTNINVWGLVPGERNQQFKLIQRSETLEAQIDSLYKPQPGQKNRSSGNFSLGHVPDGRRVRVSIEGGGETVLNFRVMYDKSADTDPTIWSNVTHGSIVTVPSGAAKSKLYIANPSLGFAPSPGGTFKVKVYTLYN